MIDLMFRASSKAAWDAFALNAGLVNTDGYIKGCAIDEIGPVVRTPGTYDADGRELTAPVIDMHHHVNLRVTGNHNPAELAKGGTDVEWVDPATIRTPTRIWSGGMNYWRP